MRLPEPRPAVGRALAELPHRPGVYILRERTGRVIYVGRSGDLATRARSYWRDLRDRPHLVRMLRRVEWLEPVICSSEHEAAFLESDLLGRHRTRWNRTLGMESMVWMRLDARPESAGLEVRHEPGPGDGARWFGPYLGWEPARLAAAGLLRLFPLRYAGARLTRTERELARSLGVSIEDAARLAARIEGVLARRADSVRDAIRSLERARARAAGRLMFEFASQMNEEIRGLRWIVQPQKLAGMDAVDGHYRAVAGSVEVVIELRAGRMVQRHVRQAPARAPGGPRPWRGAGDPAGWDEVARANAELMSRLAAVQAIGPLGWRKVRG